MSCRSEERIICPYCGAEMEIKAHPHIADYTAIYARGAKKRLYRWTAWASCTDDGCGADGPIITDMESEQEAREAASTAALRRYTPPQPMTLQKPMAKLEEALGKEIEIEIKGEDRFRKVSIPVHARMAKQFEIIVPRNIAHIAPVILPAEDYGKTWRCWERKPTDEERSAAGWEISPE